MVTIIKIVETVVEWVCEEVIERIFVWVEKNPRICRIHRPVGVLDHHVPSTAHRLVAMLDHQWTRTPNDACLRGNHLKRER